jgi:hypothetical protein
LRHNPLAKGGWKRRVLAKVAGWGISLYQRVDWKRRLHMLTTFIRELCIDCPRLQFERSVRARAALCHPAARYYSSQATLMSDPVKLPSSGQIMDRSTVRQHLLTQPVPPIRPPFNPFRPPFNPFSSPFRAPRTLHTLQHPHTHTPTPTHSHSNTHTLCTHPNKHTKQNKTKQQADRSVQPIAAEAGGLRAAGPASGRDRSVAPIQEKGQPG